MRVVLKQISVRAYEIVECPEFIKKELFSGVIQLGILTSNQNLFIQLG